MARELRKINPAKSSLVKRARGFSPEEVASEGKLLGVLRHNLESGQVVEVYEFAGYVWAVVVGLNPPRYVTAYPSRKLKREFSK